VMNCSSTQTTPPEGSGFGSSQTPDLAERVLARLFPWLQPGDDPWGTLLWANGRIDIPGRPRQTSWVWHCAPLADWDDNSPDSPDRPLRP
jgi:hypothetical protein